MNKPIINPDSETLVDLAIQKRPQSLMLIGEVGTGLHTIGQYIAESFKSEPITILPEKNEKVDIANGSITVDIMRRLYQQTRTKSDKDRTYIIDYIERMTHQAQNAFLKLLEEPNNNLHFILLSHNASKLLPTIISRVEAIYLKPITDKQTAAFIKKLGVTDKAKISQLLFIASGLPAEITRLVEDKDYFSIRSQIVRDAKIVINGSLYQKTLICQKYKDDRKSALILINDAAHILKNTAKSEYRDKTIKDIDKFLNAYERIEANGNIRLCLADMML